MTDLRDPEFDPPAPDETGPCRRNRCDGSGWLQVSQAYVDHWAPLLTDEAIDKMIGGSHLRTDDLVAALHEQRRLKRAGYARHVYPCPSCKPVEFNRWNGGHWSEDHDRANCPECVTANPGLRPRGRRKHRGESHDPDPVYTGEDEPPPLPPPRLDLDG